MKSFALFIAVLACSPMLAHAGYDIRFNGMTTTVLSLDQKPVSDMPVGFMFSTESLLACLGETLIPRACWRQDSDTWVNEFFYSDANGQVVIPAFFSQNSKATRRLKSLVVSPPETSAHFMSYRCPGADKPSYLSGQVDPTIMTWDERFRFRQYVGVTQEMRPFVYHARNASDLNFFPTVAPTIVLGLTIDEINGIRERAISKLCK